MRFSGDIILNGSPPFKIPSSYRSKILALIIETLRREEPKIYLHYWGDTEDEAEKPFTFHLSIPHHHRRKDGNSDVLECRSNSMRLSVSSCDYSLLVNLYNGLLKVINDFSPFNYAMTFSNFYFHQREQINNNRIRFKILSPLVLRKIDAKQDNDYITWEDEDFEEILFHYIEILVKKFIKPDYKLLKSMVEIKPSLCSSINPYFLTGEIAATKGVIEIKAPVEIQRLIYDTGLGLNRSYGFGMIDILR